MREGNKNAKSSDTAARSKDVECQNPRDGASHRHLTPKQLKQADPVTKKGKTAPGHAE